MYISFYNATVNQITAIDLMEKVKRVDLLVKMIKQNIYNLNGKAEVTFLVVYYIFYVRSYSVNLNYYIFFIETFNVSIKFKFLISIERE